MLYKPMLEKKIYFKPVTTLKANISLAKHEPAHASSHLIRLSVIEMGSVTQVITGGIGLHAKSTPSGSPDPPLLT